MLRNAVALILVGSIGACAHDTPVPAAESAVMPASTARAIAVSEREPVTNALKYFEYLQTLDREGLRQEYARAASDFARGPGIDARIRMIFLLTEPRADFIDLDAALELIDGYLVNAPPSPITDFVWLLESNVQARRRASQDLHKEVRRATQLQQKLDELRSIERKIEAREAPGLTQ